MDVQILFPEIARYSNSSIQNVSPNRSKRKMPSNFGCGNPSSIQMVKPRHLSKSKRKKLRLMEKKNSGLVHGGAPVCVTICENDDGLVDGSSPPAIKVEKNTSSANNPSSVLNVSGSPVVSVAVSPVALADSQSCIPLLTYNLRPQRKCCSR